MYLFTRRRRLSDGNGTAGVEWARSITAKVTDLTGHDIRLWATVYSAGYGTISWTGWFHDLEAIETLGDTLAADPAMEKLTNAGTRYSAGGLDDGLIKLIHGVPPRGPVHYVAAVVAVASPGSIERAVASGTEIAKRAESITGVPVLFGRSMTGPYRQVNWFTPYESITAMEEADAALSSDPSWFELLDSTKDLFIADTGTPAATIYRRLS